MIRGLQHEEAESCLLSAAQERVGICCCPQVYWLTNKFQFDIKENNL